MPTMSHICNICQKIPGKPSQSMSPVFSLSGAARAAEAQPERDVGDHQPGGGGGLQVEGGGQGGRRGVGQGEGRHEQQWQWQWRRGRWQVHRSWFVLLSAFLTSNYQTSSPGGSGENKENRGELPTPSSTPTSVRKNRRRSNLFTPSAKGKEKLEEKKPGEVVVIKFHFLTLLS